MSDVTALPRTGITVEQARPEADRDGVRTDGADRRVETPTGAEDRVETGPHTGGARETPPGPQVPAPGTGNAEEGGFLDGLANVFNEASEIMAHPYAQGALAAGPAVALVMGAPGLGQFISGVGAIFSLGRVFGTLFAPTPEGEEPKSFMERLGQALPDLAMSAGYLLGAIVPGGAGLLGPAVAGLGGMWLGEQRNQARERHEQQERLNAQAQANAADREAPLPPAVAQPLEALPESFDEAFTDPAKAQAVRQALDAIDTALLDANLSQVMRRRLLIQKRQLTDQLTAAGQSVAQQRMSGGDVRVDPAAVEALGSAIDPTLVHSLTAAVAPAPAE